MRKRSSRTEPARGRNERRSRRPALYEDCLHPATAFFRDLEAFRALSDDVLPRLAGKKPSGAPVRVWVAGCATGEEAYSIAICLLERGAELGASPRIQVFATDLDALSIQTARAGLYPDSIAQGISSERLSRFFERVNGHYKVASAVRETCVFARHDLFGDTPYSRMDLVSCRDLLHQLEPRARHRALATLHYALQPGGVLMIGPSERLGDTELFAPRDPQHGLYAKKATAHHPAGTPGGGTVAEKDRQIGHLERQLQESRDSLLTLLQEYDSAHEEIQASGDEALSAGEELRHINEELQTAREQVQSANEELTALNRELHDRNRDLGHTAEDLLSLLASLDIPIVTVDRDLRLRRFTPSAEPLLSLIPADVGRPLGDIRTNLDADLSSQVREVLDTSASVDREVKDREGRAYALRIRPCWTREKKIDGAVVILIDKDALKQV